MECGIIACVWAQLFTGPLETFYTAPTSLDNGACSSNTRKCIQLIHTCGGQAFHTVNVSHVVM